MDINVQAFQDAIAAGNYQTTATDITPAQLEQGGVEAALQPAFAALAGAIDQGVLAQVDLVVTSAEPTTIRLETGVINLPFADSKKVNNFLAEDATVPLRLNLIVSSPYVNQSGLRIDQVAPLDEYVAHPAANQAAIIADVSEKLIRIEAERTAPKPVVKEVPASRAKTPTRRTAAKKTTKTAATTKAAAKKPAAKRTTAAKATTASKTTATKKTTTTRRTSTPK